MRCLIIGWLMLQSIPAAVFGQSSTLTLSGYVKDAESGESLIGANIFDKGTLKGTSANHYGYYSLSVPSGKVHVVYSYVGYLPIDTVLNVSGNTTLSVSLMPQSILEEIVINAEDNITELPQMSRIRLPIEQLSALPALLGEVDVFKTLQLMPGVQSGSEGSSGLYVRGGGPDQNLILLDGVPVYNAFHLFGFFSVFNADAINNVELIKGGFPARYGGRLSSVIDISMKEGNNQKFKGAGSVGFIASKLTLEGPIVKNKSSFIVSARRTYIDILTRPFIQSASENKAIAGYYFYDLNAKVNYQFSDKDRVYLSTYLGNDKAYSRYKDSYIEDNTKYENGDEAGIKWGNTTTALRWNHVFSPKVFSNFTATYSRYLFDIFEHFYSRKTSNNTTTEDSGKIRYFSGINDISLKGDLDLSLYANHQMKAGISTIHHTFNPGVLAFSSSYFADTTLGSIKRASLEFAAYFEDDWTINRAIRLNAGLHFSGFLVEKSWYQQVQPRLNLRYLFDNGLALKASYASMAQFIHLLTNSSLGLPTDLWVPSTKKIKPQYSSQVALGLAKNLGKIYELSVEAYHKDMTNLIEYAEGASYLSVEKDWQEKIVVGKGRSYGIEILLQKKAGKFSGWLGYTLSKTERTFPDINLGRTFPYKYDRRHDVSLVGIFRPRKDIEIGATWVYGTGTAVSIAYDKYASYGHGSGGFPGSFFPSEIHYYPSRNNYRLRDYHRLDFNISKSSETSWGEQTWSFGAYNVYNRANPFFMDITTDKNGTKNFVQYSLFRFFHMFATALNFKEMKKAFLYYFMCMLLACAGCGVVVEVDLPLRPPTITLNSISNPDSVFRVDLTLNSHVLSNTEFKELSGATVSIFEEGKLVEVLKETSQEGYYRGATKPQPGHGYSIEASATGYNTVKTTDNFPAEYIEIISVDYRYINNNSNNNNNNNNNDFEIVQDNYLFHIEFDEPAGKNYYEIGLYGYRYQSFQDPDTEEPRKDSTLVAHSVDSEDPLFEEKLDIFLLFSGDLLDNTRTKLTFSSYIDIEQFNDKTGEKQESFIVVLRQLSPALFHYKRTLGIQQANSGNPFAEPTLVFNNIENGFGIFGAYVQSHKKITITEK